MSPMMLYNAFAFIGPNKEKLPCPSFEEEDPLVPPLLLLVTVVAFGASVVVLEGISLVEFSKTGCPGRMFK